MYWGIPPEINAFRLTMMGAGPTAHVPQITAYTTAAATHMEQAAQQMVTAAATAPGFEGLGGVGMLSTATPMAAWLITAGGHAAAAAGTVEAGAAAYATASAATIPYSVVVANRIREAILESTNFLGINTPAIAEANAEYGEFWAQNASAMMGYLGAVTGLVGALSVPLVSLPDMTDPGAAAAGLAGIAGEAAPLGVQALGAGFQAGSSAGAIGSAAGVAGIAGAGAASGVQALGAGVSTAGQAGSSVGSSTGVTGSGVAAAASGAQATSSGTPAGAKGSASTAVKAVSRR